MEKGQNIFANINIHYFICYLGLIKNHAINNLVLQTNHDYDIIKYNLIYIQACFYLEYVL